MVHFVKLRYFDNPREVLEMNGACLARVIDGLHYIDTGEVRYLENAARSLSSMKPYTVVEIETGFEDNEGKTTILFVMSERPSSSVTSFILNTIFIALVAVSLVGCGGSVSSYTYTCTGDACTQLMNRTPVYYIPPVRPSAETRVVYVNRPIEIEIVQHRSKPRRPMPHFPLRQVQSRKH